MANDAVEFEVYRLLIVEDEELLPIMGRPIGGDEDTIEILSRATEPIFDVTSDPERATKESGSNNLTDFTSCVLLPVCPTLL